MNVNKAILFLLAMVFASAHAREILILPELEKPSSHSNVHGMLDIVFKNDYITPRGLLVSDTGLTIQILSALVLDVYKNPNKHQEIKSISINLGIWNDLWTTQHDPKVGAWNELDWFVGFAVDFRNHLRFEAQFIEFLSPPGNFRPENNAEFILKYDDSIWNFPVVFNPYVKLFWAISGDSTVVVGEPGNTYYFEMGLTPTLELESCLFPLTITFPTWLSMGPEAFWNGGDLALKDSHSHFGVFSTGVKGSVPLQFIPQDLGAWYFDVGAQFYYLINDNLLQAQLFTLQLDSIKSSKRNVFVGFIGFGFQY